MRRRELLLTATTVMAAPHCLRAQQKAMPVIGFLGIGSPVRGKPGIGGEGVMKTAESTA
jgi:hypothetical protein